MTKWEYKDEIFVNTSDDPIVIKLNELGKVGWELVSFTRKEGTSVTAPQYFMFFKRPVK